MTDVERGESASGSGPAESASVRRRRHLEYAGLWTLGLAVPAVVLGFAGVYNPSMAVSDSAPTILGLWAIAYPLYVYRLRLTNFASFALLLAVASVVVAAVSIGTGWGNGLTDEPYAMPLFIKTILNGHNPYATFVKATYNQYGTIYQLGPERYVYLPLLIFFQPFYGGGTGYKIFVVVTWALTIYLVRKSPFAVVAIGQPYLALLAASGFNDFPVLLLLTVAFVGINGERQKWAEYLALGAKQFANVLVVGYYGVRRDWRNLAIAVGVSVAWVLPFLVWSPSTFVCGAIFLSSSGCGGTSSAAGIGIFIRLNYWVWPVWVLAVFLTPLRERYYRLRARWRRQAVSPPTEAPDESARDAGAATDVSSSTASGRSA